MCGRFTLRHSQEEVVERFEISDLLFNLEPRYNIAPSQQVAAITAESDQRILSGFKWGLVPFWAKDPAVGNKMINARAETLIEKPAFRQALLKRRCLIPADGFYEWQQQSKGKNKQPIYLRLRSQELFAFAGLWEEWQDPESATPLRSCTIITIQPNELISQFHHRMAAILPRELESNWLDGSIKDAKELINLLQPYPSDQMEYYAVSRQVNSPGFDSPECIAAATQGDQTSETDQQPSLF